MASSAGETRRSQSTVSVSSRGNESSGPSRVQSLASMREEVIGTFNVQITDTDHHLGRHGSAIVPLTGTPSEKGKKKKKSLSHWRNYTTISWRVDEHKDFNLGHDLEKRAKTPQVQEGKGLAEVKKMWHWAVSWVVPALIGIFTAISGHYIERGVNYLNPLRFGYCSDPAHSRNQCKEAQGHWVMWDGEAEDSGLHFKGYFLYVLISIALATISATIVWLFAPMARGSGIPEVKTILGGFCMNEALELKTLVVKMIGLTLSVSSGLSLGKEGPLVHVACCWSHLLARISSRYSINESKRRELLSTAAAAGVSVAFGAPLGGVLFSFEEVSTMFPTKTMIRAFWAASVAALTLGILNASSTEHPGKLTMFVTKYEEAPHYTEYPYFLILGIIGGLVGALFVHWNIMISTNRADGTPWRRRVPIVLEVALIALVTGITSYPNMYTATMSSETIRALFHNCQDPDKPDMTGLCDKENAKLPELDTDLMYQLTIAAVIRFLQMTMTFGTGVPCGLFVPSLFTGACIGRVFGMAVRYFHITFNFAAQEVNPGVYAMIGAAAVLGGVCRVTISLVVIMFELTNGLTMVVPFMLAVLAAKMVGEQFTGGIYDCCIKLRGYPYLHEPDDITFNSRACDIMDSDLDCLTLQPGSMDELLTSLETTRFAGLPLVRSEAEPQLIGFVFKRELIEWIKKEKEKNPVSGKMQVAFKEWCKDPDSVKGIDVSSHVDAYIMRIVPETPLAQVHNIFRQLGVKLLLITMFGELKGMITKKAYLDELSNGSIGHVTEDPAVVNIEAKCEVEGGRASMLSVPMERQQSNDSLPGSIRLSCRQKSGATFRLSTTPTAAHGLEEGLLPEGKLGDFYQDD